MPKKLKFLHGRKDVSELYAAIGRDIRDTPDSKQSEAVQKRFKETGDWLRMDKTVAKWTPVQKLYDEAYQSARSKGFSPKRSHLKAKMEVLTEFPWVNERDLCRDTGRGIIPYD